MNIWNKVMLGLIALLAIFATLWSAKELKIQSSWGTAAKKLEAATLKVQADRDRLMKEDEIPAWEVREYEFLADHAENWRDCKPKSFQRGSGFAKIVFNLGTSGPSGMNQGDTIYVFDNRTAEEGGCFLGRFNVKEVQGNEISATSIDFLNEIEAQHLEKSLADEAPWSVHTKCPTDRPDLFAKMPASERDKYLSPKLLELYVEGYQPVDFGTVLAYYFELRVKNREALAEKLSEKRALEESKKIASDQQQFYRNEIDRVQEETSIMKSQRDEVAGFAKALDNDIAQKKQKIQKTQKENEQLLEDIKKLQTQILQKNES